MPPPNNLRLKVNDCLDAYLRKNDEKPPKYALVTPASSELFSTEMTCIDGKNPDIRYLSHDNPRVVERIRVVVLDNLKPGIQFPFGLSKYDDRTNEKSVLVDLASDKDEIKRLLDNP